MTENNNFEVKDLGTKSVWHSCKNIPHKKTGDPQKNTIYIFGSIQL